MNIQELDAYNLADAVKFNDRLNPALWDRTEHLHDDVRAQLLLIAEDFRESLGIKDLDLKDITISGSNAAYTYTPNSDIDLHLVVDQPEDPIYRELFDAKKAQYNDTHDITVKGFDVELYVEAADKPPVSQGTYSLLQNKWTQVPRRVKADVDDDSTRNKFKSIGHGIERAVKSGDRRKMDRMARKIKRMRQTGLEQHGEFGPENLAFKILRSQGMLKKLHDARIEAKNKELSLKERKKPHSVFTYGFKHESEMGEDLDSDGVMMTRPTNCSSESIEFKEDLDSDGVMMTRPTNCSSESAGDNKQSDKNILKDFIDFCVKELKIEELPVIKLRRDPQWPVVNKTFGRYTNEKKMLEVAWGERHIMDVLRTVAHELTHRHQHERDGEAMGPEAGETGSKWENEANARAGILMRDYARLHPDYFEGGQVEELHGDEIHESASGYIPTKKQAKDPRFSTALTVDIKPGQLGKEANKLKLRTNSQGKPQQLRANGLFENLYKEYKQFKRAEEDYSPDSPPGPEFKPTMPKGTVRVDVSDMYDWYKLGKNISNLKGADKSQFGKGPPSTIVSFGDENTEHKYINDLENLGLTTTDIDPLDPNQPVGMPRQSVDRTYNVDEGADKDNEQYYKFLMGKHRLGRPLTRQEQEFIRTYQIFNRQQVAESEQLDEVSMRPSTLKQFAMSPEAEGIQAGFEAELIFRDTLNDNDDEELEPDYDADERCRSLSQIVEFFEGGEYGYLSPRQRNALEENLDERYYEWYDEQMYSAFRDEEQELIRDIWLEERPWSERMHDALVEGVGVTDEEADRIFELGEREKRGELKQADTTEEEKALLAQYGEAAGIADDILDEDVQNSIDQQDKYYDSALDNFRDNFQVDDDSGFFDDVGLRWMSDVASEYDLDWPYMTGASNGGSRDWENIADSLNQAIDMPVKVSSGYHSATRKPGLWIVEPDSSLDPDDREDYGLEIVSPPMPLAQALEKLQEVTDWANGEGDAYTNQSTGLHMGVSIPYKEGRVDYLKLILFLGDEYVLQQYGREANTYTKAAIKEIRQRAGSEKNAAAVLELLKHNLLELAEREIAKSTGEGKYTSAHKHGKYIEFRSAGGDWLAEDNAEPGKLENTMMRYAYAMYLAGHPELERKEYAKKLYKLVSNNSDDSTMALFSKFAAGEINKEQLKKDWAEKTLSKEVPSSVAKNNWVVIDNNTGKTVPGQEYNGYTEDEVRERAKAKLSPGSSDLGFDRAYSIHPKETGKWEVYRDDHGQEETLEIIDADRRGEAVDKAYDKYTGVIPFKVRAYYGDQEAGPTKELSPRAKLAKRIKDAPKEQPQMWQVVNRKTGEVYATERGTKSGLGAALRGFEKSEGIPQGDAVLRLAPDQSGAKLDDDEASDWEAVYTPTGRVIDTLAYASADQAQTWRQMVIRQHDFTNQAELIVVRRAGEQTPDVAQNFSAQSTNPNPTIQEPNQVRMPNGVPVWEIYQRDNGHVVHTFADHTQREAWGQAQGWLRGIGAEDLSLFSVRPKLLQPGERNTAGEHTPPTSGARPQDATQRVGSWSIYDVTLGREISRMDNVSWQQASDRADELERSTGHNMSVRGLQ